MDKRVIVLATSNEGKRSEFAHALSETGYELITLPEHVQMPEETGATFQENALLKARSVCAQTGLPALADDSGLEVAALQGAPGVYSARYAGAQATDGQNITKLLQALHGVTGKGRQARFVCALAFVTPDDSVCLEVQGQCVGEITHSPVGTAGFGYDPVFYYEPLRATFAQLSPSQKNLVSHRAQALVLLREVWRARK
ncbi:MAG: RdgB/HAM1 family non-canonical purine NTP pyrophosphatase [Firmicutes bacterium]|nr:RdgB/HAM1 family non-canonical purine NTP pyrophosphatase [Bacillota bacterium]